LSLIPRFTLGKSLCNHPSRHVFAWHGALRSFSYYIEERPNDWFYEMSWLTYRVKTDGSGEVELFGSTSKEADPDGERMTGQEYMDWDVVKAMMDEYGKDIFFEN
jgi:hypothetical protein